MFSTFLLESGMLLCFSVSWYCSVFRMLRIREATGKSAAFVLLICAGYIMGVLWKLSIWHETGVLSPVTWLYAWNGVVVALDLVLVLHYTKRERADGRRSGIAISEKVENRARLYKLPAA